MIKIAKTRLSSPHTRFTKRQDHNAALYGELPIRKPMPEPHVTAGITKAMLMGGRAPVARVRS